MDVKKEFIRLKEQWVRSSGEARRKADDEMQAFFDSLQEEDKALLTEAVDEDFARLHKEVEETRKLAKQLSIRKQMEEVLPFISVSEFAKTYFGRSASWLHQRINGNVIHGKPAMFTPDEIKTLSHALNDVAAKLQRAATAVA